MKFIRAKHKEDSQLWSALVVAILIAIYAAAVQMIDSMRAYFAPDAGFPLIDGLMYGLVLWLMCLIWVAYRKWRNVQIMDYELDNIIKELNLDCVLVVDPDRHIVMSNPAVQSMFGYKPDEILIKTTDLLYEDRRSMGQENHEIFDHLEKVGFHVGIATGKKKDGRRFPLEIITGNLQGRRGAVLQIRDITKLIQAEEAHIQKAELLNQLQDNYKKLKETEHARDNLLQMIVHDMKNPLQVILGNLELLKMDEPGMQNEMDGLCLNEAFSHTQRLIDMVNSMLDVSRLESGDMPLSMTALDARVTAKRSVASLGLLAQGRSISFQAPHEPVMVEADPDILQRVLVNLLSNAINHTSNDAEIMLEVHAGDGAAIMLVSDAGDGIPVREQEQIFNKFSQGSSKKNGRTSSTGIGLTFCRLAVEAHQGQIGVNSQPGEGSTFWISLPLLTRAGSAV